MFGGQEFSSKNPLPIVILCKYLIIQDKSNSKHKQ